MASYDEEIPDADKIKIASDFVLNAPPGEFNEVFNDVRVLLNNDTLLKEGAARAFAKYNKDQFTAVQLPGQKTKTLVTKHGEINETTFLDPRSGQSFEFDHLRKEVSNVQPASRDDTAEPHRAALESAITAYTENHYPNGVSAVYGSSSGSQVTLAACIEDHKFNPSNFWNGRWRSEWTVTYTPGSGSAELKGSAHVQVHYYEDGNVQLVTSRDFKDTLPISSADGTAKKFVEIIEKAENEYQTAISENYSVMSDTIFKALRRALPITRSKLDWNKILNYKIGSELQK
eukprot:Opistho-1_new@24380